MYEGVVQDLIDELGKLPGVGPKSAQRIAFHLLQADEPDVRRLADVLVEVKARVKFCSGRNGCANCPSYTGKAPRTVATAAQIGITHARLHLFGNTAGKIR